MQPLLGSNTAAYLKYLTKLKVQEYLSWQTYFSWNLSMNLMSTSWLFTWGPVENPRGLFHISPQKSPGEFAQKHVPVAESPAPSLEVSQPRIYSWFALACISDCISDDTTDSSWVTNALSEKPSIYTIINETSACAPKARSAWTSRRWALHDTCVLGRVCILQAMG